jgi:hypothetical protein
VYGFTCYTLDRANLVLSLYHIHTNPIPPDGNCTAARGHLSPLNESDAIVCDPLQPWFCETGVSFLPCIVSTVSVETVISQDLSGKHGTLRGTPSGSIPPFSYDDEYLRFFPQPFSLLGRSVVVHFHNKTRIGCGNITSKIDGTENKDGKPNQRPGNYVTLVCLFSQSLFLAGSAVN